MHLAFFDLDKTLIADNSARLFVREQYRAGNLTFIQLLFGSFWLLKYRLGFTKIVHLIKKSALSIRGKNSKEFEELTKNFYQNTIKNLYRPYALKALAQHKKRGEKTVLLTSSIDLLAGLVASELGFDYLLSTRLEIDKNGFFTGHLIGEPCFGPYKIQYAELLCQDLGADLSNATFYTDSASDLPLLYVVKNPVVINPDVHLWVKAKLNRWPILDWGKP